MRKSFRPRHLAPWTSWLFFIALLLAASPARVAAAPGLNPAKLADMDATVERTIAEKEMPGAVLWVEHQGTAYHKAYGSRALIPEPEPMTEDTIFDVASLTKVIATTPSILLLIERGQVKLDAPVCAYVTEFTEGGKSAVTIRHLLTHTSGLRPGIGGQPAWEGYEGAISRACAEELQTVPGTAFRYSDINFFLLGEVVRRVSGHKLQEFAAQEIYQPLKMRDTGFLPSASLAKRIAPTQQVGNEMLRGTVHDPTARHMGGAAGHAGLFTTAADLARYARMLLRGGELDGVRIFKPETVHLMTTVQTPEAVADRRGLGWDLDSGYSRPRGKLFPLGSFGHTGFTGTALWIDPFSETFWILLSNRVHPNGRGNVLPLYSTLGTLTAMAVDGFDYTRVPNALPAQASAGASGSGAASGSGRARTGEVLNGIDALVKQNYAPLKKLRLGLITNQTGVDRHRRPTIDLLKNAPEVELKVLFSPEHGIRGQLDEKVNDGLDEKTGLPVYSLYGARRAPSPEQLRDLDALVFDIQDIGCRFYTYISTLGLCLEAAAQAKLKFFVLDRVNPLNGVTVEGPVHHGDSSFTAYHALPLRYGMTLGELAQMYNTERKLNADLVIIRLQGWSRELWFDQTGLPWINPSPNMRSLTAAILYPGLGLHETALSVGRGTGTPFEIAGAPYIDDVKLAAEFNRAGLPGVRCMPLQYTPTYSTFKDKPCAGVYLAITDRDRLQAVDAGIVLAQILYRLHPKDFALDKIQTLLQSRETLEAIRAGKSLAEIKTRWQSDLADFNRRREQFLIYK